MLSGPASRWGLLLLLLRLLLLLLLQSLLLSSAFLASPTSLPASSWEGMPRGGLLAPCAWHQPEQEREREGQELELEQVLQPDPHEHDSEREHGHVLRVALSEPRPPGASS
jgi:hypothetical protein